VKDRRVFERPTVDWSELRNLSDLRSCMEITRPFRVPLALPVFVTRRGQSNSALAEPVAHSLAEPVAHRTKR